MTWREEDVTDPTTLALAELVYGDEAPIEATPRWVDAIQTAERILANGWVPAERGQTVVEYSIFRDGVNLVGPSLYERWNPNYTYQEAIERWYPGGVLMKRMSTNYRPTLTEWEEVKSGG
jgi:hypothetical protein